MSYRQIQHRACPTRFRRWTATPAVAGMLAFGLVACSGGGTTPAASGGTTPASLENVDLRLNWVLQGQYAPIYLAKASGYWTDCGLNVNIIPGTGSAVSAVLVGTGKVDFGLTGAVNLIPARLKGVPITSLGVWQQSDPSAFISLKETGILTPEDLQGKTFGAVPGGAPYQIALAFLKQNGITGQEVTVPDPGYGPLLTGQVDYITSFDTVVNALSDDPEKDLNVMRFADFGSSMYGLVLATDDSHIKYEPAAVQCMVDGFKRGLEEAKINPTAAMDALMASQPALVPTRAAEEAMLELVFALYDDPVLGQDTAGWEQSVDRLVSSGIIEEPEEPLDVSELFTNDFLPSN